jgi:phosphoribosylformylglycinamidine synthase
MRLWFGALVVTDEADAATDELRAFAARGGPVLGVGRGFVALCRAGLLPGAVIDDDDETPAAAAGFVRVEGRPTPFTWAIPAGRVIPIDAALPRGRYTGGDLAALESAGRVLFRYCDPAGGVDGEAAADVVAGICNLEGNVVGILPGASPPPAWWEGGLGRQLLASLHLGGADGSRKTRS